MRQFAQGPAVGVLLTALACGPSAPVSAPPPSSASGSATVVGVHLAPVRSGEISQRVFAPGSVVARRVSQIGAEVPGRIEEIFVDVGDRVEGGAPLFQIDRSPYQAALRAALSGVDLARAERRQLASDLERLKVLREDGVGSQSELERARTAYAVSVARERQAEEAVAMARLDLARTRVEAPYAGSIAKRLVDEGTTALAQPQTIVVVIQETAVLEAQADVPERQLAVVRAGDPALVHVEGLPEPIHTSVDTVADTIDPATRTYGVRMRIPNPDHRLKAGVFARVEIQPASKQVPILIPRDAIRTADAQTRVLVVREGRAIAVPVEIGLVTDSEAEVLSGLEPDSRVIVGREARELASGMRVRELEARAAAESSGDAPPPGERS